MANPFKRSHGAVEALKELSKSEILSILKDVPSVTLPAEQVVGVELLQLASSASKRRWFAIYAIIA